MSGERNWPKDPDLVEVYGHVDFEVAPPPPLEAVAARIGQRRRRRRGAVVAATAAVAVTVVSVAVGARDGGQDGRVAVDPPENLLRVTEADGSTFTFTDFTIGCETDDQGRESILVTSGTGETTDDGSLLSPIFSLSMPVENGEGTAQVYELPPERERVEGQDLPPGIPPITESPFVLFVATEERPGGNNEATSGEDGAAGTFEVGGAACGTAPSIDFAVQGQLGSEVDQPPLEIEGEVHLG